MFARPAHGRLAVLVAASAVVVGALTAVSSRAQGPATAAPRVLAAVNAGPVVQEHKLVAAEDTPLQGALVATAPDGDALTFAVSSNPKRGTVVIEPSGAFRFTPAKNAHGTDSFKFTVSDGKRSASATATVQISPVDDPPRIQPLQLSASEDGSVRGQLEVVDDDGDVLAFAVARAPGHGVGLVDAKTGRVTFTPAKNFHGTDTFTVTVSAAGAGATAEVSVTVTPQNDAPVAQASELTLAEDGAGTGKLAATDVDGDALSFAITSKPKRGSVTVDEKTGAVKYLPAINLHGDDAFTFEVSDGKLRSKATVTVHVTPVDDPPVAPSIALTTDEEVLVRAKVSALDVDGDVLAYALDPARSPAHGAATVDASTGAVTYMPTKDFHGEDTFVVFVNGAGAKTPAVVTIKVAPQNDAPVAQATSASIDEDGTLQGKLVASDVDGDALTFKIQSNAKHGAVTVDAKSGAFSYQPAKDFHGEDAFTCEVSDGRARATIAARVRTLPKDDPPVARPPALTLAQTLSTAEDTLVRAQVSAVDVDGDALSYTLDAKRAPAHGTATVDASTGAVTYTPTKDFHGEDTFTVFLSAAGAKVPAVVTIKVAPQNDDPVAQATGASIDEDGTLQAKLVATDVDGDALTFKMQGKAKHGTVTVDAKSGGFSYQPAKDWHGEDAFGWEVSDGRARHTATTTVRTLPIDDPPTATPPALVVTTNEDTPLRAQVKASDVDGDAISYAPDAKRAPAHGAATVDASTGAVTYTPAKDFHGDDTFVVRVSAAKAHVAVEVSVKVAPQNDAPVAQATSGSIDEDGTLKGKLLANDVDGDALTFKAQSNPKHGTVTVDAKSGAFSYQPAKDFHGDDAFTFEVSDGRMQAKATAALRTQPVDDAPVARPPALALTTVEDTVVRGQAGALDVDGDVITYATDPARAPAHGAVTVEAATGAFTYTPAKDFHGDDVFAVRITAAGVHTSAEVRLKVTPQNDAPVAAAAELAVDEDGQLEGALVATDIDGDALTFKTSSAPKRGSVTVEEKTGAFRYVPNKDHNGEDTFAFTVSDGARSAVATATIRTAPVNDAPVARNLELATREDTAAKATIAASDVDKDTLVYRVATKPAHGEVTIDARTGAFTFTPTADKNGVDSFTIEVADQTATATATVSVTVAAVPDAPRVQQGALVQTNEDTPVAGGLPATDPDGDALQFKLAGQPRLGTAVLEDAATGAWRYTPKAHLFGVDEITFEVTGGGERARGVVKVNIAPQNDAPELLPVELSTREDTPVVGTLSGTDVDGDPLRYTVAAAPARGTVTIEGASLRYQPALNDTGDVTFTVTANDATARSKPAQVVVHLAPVNDAPVLKNQDVDALEDVPLDGQVVATDVDKDPLTFRVRRAPGRGKITALDPTTGTFRFTPERNLSGPDWFTVEAMDGDKASAVATVRIDVKPVDDAPIGRPAEVLAPRSGRVSGKLEGYDPEAGTVTFHLHTEPRFGRVEITNERTGEYELITDGVAGGSTFFLFTVSDGKQSSAPAKVNVSIRR